MEHRAIFFICILWIFSLSQGFAQILADFTFDDTTNMPASLKKNAVGPDGLHINPNALSDGEGVYTISDPDKPGEDQNIELEISESLLNHTESVYLEFDFRAQEDFCWFIFSGYERGLDLFRFGHGGFLDQPDQQGFHIRYATKADPDKLISSGYVGEAVKRGERALIAFVYDAESGMAQIYKDGMEVWQTPDSLKTPGHPFHWQTANGSLFVGSHMNGNGSTTPSLYRFRAFENACPDVFLPTVEAGANITIMKGESTELFASGDFLSCSWSALNSIVEGADHHTIEVTPDVTETYIVTAVNENGCELSDTVTVFVLNKFPVPNAFSPNNDGLNDTWEIPNIKKYPDCRIAVFNRWGNEVFSSTGYEEPWDGHLNGQPLPFGTYYYTIQLKNDDHLVKGSLFIMK